MGKALMRLGGEAGVLSPAWAAVYGPESRLRLVLSRLVPLLVALSAILLLSGCAAGYSGTMKKPLKRLERRDYQGALAKLEKPEGATNKLLYRLERGLILHYMGSYVESNAEFDKAERLVDRHYTRSLSREIASLISNDALRAYSGEEYERVLIHYYRGLNYAYLGDMESALVECRKANNRLADYAQEAEYELNYKNDAFIQYMTGLFFAARNELNDAYISFRDAEKGYRAYNEAFGLQMPRALALDLAYTAQKLGYRDEVDGYMQRYGIHPDELRPRQNGQVIVFIENGFVGRKRQSEINVPILEGEGDEEVWVLSDRLARRHYHRRHYSKVHYWLRVALPYYEPIPSQVFRARLSGGGASAVGTTLEDLDAIASQSFKDKEHSVLLRTLARALAKYWLAQKAEDQLDKAGDDEGSAWNAVFGLIGGAISLVGAATEAADTRSWLSLPGRIQMARLDLPAGTHDLDLEFFNQAGNAIENHRFPQVQVAKGETVFLSYRSYR
jgi:uncharacterized protein